MEQEYTTDYYSSVSSASAASAPTTEIPILYFSTHGVFDVETDDSHTEEEPELGLAIPIPRDMTILKYNFVPINVCNYGGSGKIGQKNIPNYIHKLIIEQLDPATIMARYGFKYFLSGDERANSIILNSGLEKYNYKGSKFIDVPIEFYGLLYHVAQLQGLEQETILDKIISELNDCKVNDTAISGSKLSEIEIESIMRCDNVKEKNAIMMKIINECVEEGVKYLKLELNQGLAKTYETLKYLRETILYPRLDGKALSHKDQKEITDTFEKEPEVSKLIESINNVTAYLSHVDDLKKLSHWNISIPNKSGKARYILNKTFSLQPDNTPDGMDWNITMFNPKTGIVKDIFGLKEENKDSGTHRRMTLKQILGYLERKGMKTVILIDQTCSVFREFTPDFRLRNVDYRTERRWANTVRKLTDGDTIYGGKRKKRKTKKQKRKTKKRKKH